VSVPIADELTAPAAAQRRTHPAAITSRLTGARLYVALAGLALVVGAVSLLLPSTPSYDPWAWLVWGREIVHLNLHTTGGPSWKPLPVIFTTLFAPFGKAAPDLWLVVARAGAVMSVAMVFKVCVRLTRQLAARVSDDGDTSMRVGGLTALGPALLAGLIAAVGLTFSGGFISDNGLGYSEGLMTALVLIAVDRHLDGKRRQAFAIGFLAALDRPEIWLFWGPYGLWLWWKDPEARKLVAALFLLIPLFWFLPEYWGSGHFFRGVNRAQHPRSNSPAFAKFPFWTELADHAWPQVLLRIKVFTALAVGAAGVLLWRGHRARGSWRLSTIREHALAGIILAGLLGAGWWVVIGIMTQAGFSGNNRYLVLGAALIEIAGAVGWGWLALELGRTLPRYVPALRSAGQRTLNAVRWGALALVLALFLLLPNFVGNNLIDIQRTHRSLTYQAHLREGVTAAVRRLGGPAGVLRCGTVMTEGFQVPMLAWTLGVHTTQVQASPVSLSAPPPPAPNVIFQTRAQRNAHLLPLLSTWPSIPYKLVTRNRTFRVFEHCSTNLTR
jgi:hypothetical protein